jgi:hypothetical protein
MDKVEKVKVALELFELINSYYINRDMPTDEDNFFIKVENCCDRLDLDFNEFKKEFSLYSWNEII